MLGNSNLQKTVMVDEMFDRDYQARRQELNAGIDAGVANLVAAMRNGFEVLNRIQFDAPWAAPVKRRRGRNHRAGIA